MKNKLSKPRDWAIVHLIKKHNSGEHNNRKSRKNDKQKLYRQIKIDYNV